MKAKFGILLILIGLFGLSASHSLIDSVLGILIIFILTTSLAIGIWTLHSANKKIKEVEAKDILEKQLLETEKYNELKSKEVNNKINQANLLNKQIQEIKNINIPAIDDFKKIIIDNEKSIVEKGGENQLYSFLKIDSFLKDYQGRIVADNEELISLIDIKNIKSRIIEESARNDLGKLQENLQNSLAKLDGKNPIGFDGNLEELFKISRFIKPNFENQTMTLEFYKNMATAMIIFYQNDKKIKYFEIYGAFEKLGVFDSTWQKNVLNQLDKIEVRLAQINNQLTDLNQNFISLVESSESIVSELKEINSSILTNNMLQTITAYQTWRINRNTKSLRN